MTDNRIRLAIDPALWDAVQTAATALEMPVHSYVDKALRAYIDPTSTIDTAAKLVRNLMQTQSETQDQIRVLSDYIVDRMQIEHE